MERLKILALVVLCASCTQNAIEKVCRETVKSSVCPDEAFEAGEVIQTTPIYSTPKNDYRIKHVYERYRYYKGLNDVVKELASVGMRHEDEMKMYRDSTAKYKRLFEEKKRDFKPAVIYYEVVYGYRMFGDAITDTLIVTSDKQYAQKKSTYVLNRQMFVEYK